MNCDGENFLLMFPNFSLFSLLWHVSSISIILVNFHNKLKWAVSVSYWEAREQKGNLFKLDEIIVVLLAESSSHNKLTADRVHFPS